MNEFDILNGFNNVDILKNAPEQSVKKDYKDSRFWKITKDKEGNGSAMIRLLTDKNKIPYVKIFHYSSRKKVGDKEFFLIVNSPDSIGLPCPIKEHFFELTNQGLKDEARMFSRKVKYYTNIYVEKDPGNPENEGKVFLWEFGQKMLDKFTTWMTEEDIDMGIKPKNLFNPLSGNSIKLVINYNSNTKFYEYDKTMVSPTDTSVGGLKDKDKIVDILLNQTYDLNEFKSEEYFESYDEIKKRLNYFINPFSKNEETKETNYTSPLKQEDKKQEDEDNLSWDLEENKSEKEKKVEKVEKEDTEKDWTKEFDDLFD